MFEVFDHAVSLAIMLLRWIYFVPQKKYVFAKSEMNYVILNEKKSVIFWVYIM